MEKKKLALASDLHWLIGEGHVIEFNDGALDLPRMKPPAAPQAANPNGKRAAQVPSESSVEAAANDPVTNENVVVEETAGVDRGGEQFALRLDRVSPDR